MLNYFKNKKTGELVTLNTETNEITEFERVLGESEPREADTVGEKIKHHKKKYASRKKKIKSAGKAKGGRECVECGKTVPPGKNFTKGKCAACYTRGRYQVKHGKAQGEIQNRYECIDCGEIILTHLDIEHAECPKNEMHKLVQK